MAGPQEWPASGLVSVLKKKAGCPAKNMAEGSHWALSRKSFPLLLGTNIEFIIPSMVLPTPWEVGLRSSALLLIPGRKVFIRTKEEPVLPKASMGRHHMGLLSDLETVTSGWHGQK